MGDPSSTSADACPGGDACGGAGSAGADSPSVTSGAAATSDSSAPMSEKGLAGRSSASPATATSAAPPMTMTGRRSLRRLERRAVASDPRGPLRSSSSQPDARGPKGPPAGALWLAGGSLSARASGACHSRASFARPIRCHRSSRNSATKLKMPPTSRTARKRFQRERPASRCDRVRRRGARDDGGGAVLLRSMSSQSSPEPLSPRPSKGEPAPGGPPARRVRSCLHGRAGLIGRMFLRTRHLTARQPASGCRPRP